MGKEWSFTQLGGRQRTIKLTDRAAPFGRPRKNPVVSDGVKLRKYRAYYPDQIAPPTTHIFGVQYDDWDLKGRFADKWLGPGGTKAAIADWQLFVAEAQPVIITWGDVLTARGIVDAFQPGRESEWESSYTITVVIDELIGAVTTPTIGVAPPPGSLAAAIADAIASGIGGIPQLPNAGDLQPSFLDGIADLIDNVANLSASLLNIVQGIDDFEGAAIGQLNRLRACVHQFKTAMLKLRDAIDTTENDAILLARASDADVQWMAARADNDVATLAVLALLEQMDREAEIAERGRILTTYIARGGDTWELIATTFYGGPDGAGQIRDANGVTYGSVPVPGRSYLIPVPP